ncbi:MAG: methylenetetrahydrofolate reductase C-terminal domain-containing protein, partial [bacterium]
GSNFLMTQIGWDLRKFEELGWFLSRRGYHPPLIAEVLLLTPERSRRIRGFGLPGVTITDQFARRLEEDAELPDGGGGAAFRRLALQIAILRDLGYAGVQVSGLARYPSVVRLLEETESVARIYPTPESRREAWGELTAQVAPPDGLYLQSAAAEPSGIPEATAGAGVEWSRFRALDLIDRLVFEESSVGARTLGAPLRRVDPGSGFGSALLWTERAIKGPLLGCQTCGFCRLPLTAYVCPETCPKGLANGPCGGTKDNVCEFGDRECIHNQIYRVSKQAGVLTNLEEILIPPVPEAAWDTCSWITHFRGEGPKVKRLR